MGVSGFSSEVSGFSSGISGFSSGVFGLSAGISRNRNFGNALRRSDGTSREMKAPPFEHLVYIYAHTHTPVSYTHLTLPTILLV